MCRRLLALSGLVAWTSRRESLSLVQLPWDEDICVDFEREALGSTQILLLFETTKEQQQ